MMKDGQAIENKAGQVDDIQAGSADAEKVRSKG